MKKRIDCKGQTLHAVLGRTRKDGTAYTVITFRCVDGPICNQEVSYVGSFKMAWMAKGSTEALRTAGWDGISMADLSSVKGSVVRLVIDIDDADGRAMVKFVNPVESRGVHVARPMTREEAISLQQKLQSFGAETPDSEQFEVPDHIGFGTDGDEGGGF